MAEEMADLNQAETTNTRLFYETPELRKHGTIHEITLTTFSSAEPEDNSVYNLTDNAPPPS